MAIDSSEQKTGNQLYQAYKKGKQFFDNLFHHPDETPTKKPLVVTECATAGKTDEGTIKWPLPEKK